MKFLAHEISVYLTLEYKLAFSIMLPPAVLNVASYAHQHSVELVFNLRYYERSVMVTHCIFKNLSLYSLFINEAEWLCVYWPFEYSLCESSGQVSWRFSLLGCLTFPSRIFEDKCASLCWAFFWFYVANILPTLWSSFSLFYFYKIFNDRDY